MNLFLNDVNTNPPIEKSTSLSINYKRTLEDDYILENYY